MSCHIVCFQGLFLYTILSITVAKIRSFSGISKFWSSEIKEKFYFPFDESRENSSKDQIFPSDFSVCVSMFKDRFEAVGSVSFFLRSPHNGKCEVNPVKCFFISIFVLFIFIS